MGKFLFNNLEYVVGITSAVIGITAFFIRLKKPVKNYGNLTPLVIKHKKMQQAIAPSKKLF